MSVGGTIGGRRGGEARKQQMAEEHGGDVHAAYSEMGQTGAKKGKVAPQGLGNLLCAQVCLVNCAWSIMPGVPRMSVVLVTAATAICQPLTATPQGLAALETKCFRCTDP